MSRMAIVVAMAIVAMGVGAAACEINTNGECGNQGARLDGDGGGGGQGGEGGGPGGQWPNGDGWVCEGCFLGPTCELGRDLKKCGSQGATCAACGFGESCVTGACVAGASICIDELKAEGLGADCATDTECGASEWCADSCCDPVSHACFAVGKCVPKRAAGEHCDHVGGDHQCSSGTCDPVSDECA